MKRNEDMDLIVQDKSETIQLKAALAYIAVTIGLAKTGLLGAYTDELIISDIAITGFVGITSILFVKSISTLASKKILEPRDSRKVIHICSAPIFMLFWPFFSDSWGARLFAASIALFQALRLFFAGKGLSG